MRHPPKIGARVQFRFCDSPRCDLYSPGTVTRTFRDRHGELLCLIDWDNTDLDDIDNREGFCYRHLETV